VNGESLQVYGFLSIPSYKQNSCMYCTCLFMERINLYPFDKRQDASVLLVFGFERNMTGNDMHGDI
jgi:hypothetical protein